MSMGDVGRWTLADEVAKSCLVNWSHAALSIRKPADPIGSHGQQMRFLSVSTASDGVSSATTRSAETRLLSLDRQGDPQLRHAWWKLDLVGGEVVLIGPG